MRSKIMLFEHPPGFPGGGLVGEGVSQTPPGAPQNGAAGVGVRDATGTGPTEVAVPEDLPGRCRRSIVTTSC